MNRRNALNQYQQVSTQTGVIDADPHRLVAMLMEGAMDRMALAKGHMERKDFEKKGIMLNKVITIIGGLQSHLNLERGGEIAQNLDRLYDYMALKLTLASAKNDTAIIDEVQALMANLKSGWDGIREEVTKKGLTRQDIMKHLEE